MNDLFYYLTGESRDLSMFDFDITDLDFEARAFKSTDIGGVRYVLDKLFEGIKFDKKLIKRLGVNNVEFVTRNPEIRDMMGGKLIGCYHIKYTQYHKNIFYQDVFGLTYDEVMVAIKEIKSIPDNFKVAKDDINLISFYVAHRFLSNRELSQSDKREGAMEILNYFGYRTLVLLSSNYWIYPISRDIATTLIEHLSGNYLITNLKNWNEYVYHRSENYLKGNYVKNVISMSDDSLLPNSINDLFNGYKDTLLNIYEEFINLEDSNIIGSGRNIVTDVEGRDVLMDRLTDPRSNIDKVLNALSTEDTFIRREITEVSSTIITSISQDQLTECLDLVYDFYNKNPKQSKLVGEFVADFIIDSINYLQDRRMSMNNKTNIVDIVNTIVGSILYSRGTDVSITAIKDRGERLIKDVYKAGRVSISPRNLSGMRNIFCVYILILSLV